jgi:DnaK suppressor protein
MSKQSNQLARVSTFVQTQGQFPVKLETAKMRAQAWSSHLMSKTERKQYESILLSMEADLAGRLGNRDGIEIEKTADPLDEVQSAGERELAIRNLHRDSNLLRKVRSALARLPGGTYGECLHCDAEIKAKRLAAVPWTPYCIQCQEAADRQEFQTAEDLNDLMADAA